MQSRAASFAAAAVLWRAHQCPRSHPHGLCVSVGSPAKGEVAGPDSGERWDVHAFKGDWAPAPHGSMKVTEWMSVSVAAELALNLVAKERIAEVPQFKQGRFGDPDRNPYNLPVNMLGDRDASVLCQDARPHGNKWLSTPILNVLWEDVDAPRKTRQGRIFPINSLDLHAVRSEPADGSSRRCSSVWVARGPSSRSSCSSATRWYARRCAVHSSRGAVCGSVIGCKAPARAPLRT